MIVRGILVWLALVAVAIGNGALRELVLLPRVGAGIAHVLSTLLLAALILAIAALTIRWTAPRDSRDTLAIGALWLLLTIAFEFGFGHWVARKPWDVLLEDYNLLAGRVWILIPVVTALAPALAARFTHAFQRGRC